MFANPSRYFIVNNVKIKIIFGVNLISLELLYQYSLIKLSIRVKKVGRINEEASISIYRFMGRSFIPEYTKRAR
jgi:hypothetical protein